MKFLFTILVVFTTQAFAQKTKVENPRFDFYKQTATIYTDSAFKNKKDISLDFQKFVLLRYKNGGWQALRSGLSSQLTDTVYIKDDQFVKTPEYREALEYYAPSFKAKHKAYYMQLVKQYGKKIADGIYNGVPVIGMNRRQFYMCVDKPTDRNVTNANYGNSEQLVYRIGGVTRYYYFNGDKLTAIQN